MATLRKKRKLAEVLIETSENTGNTQSQNTKISGMAEEYITQVSEEIQRVNGGSIKNFPKTLAGRSHAFWVFCLNSMTFY